jgi:hypothetical protein
MAKEFDGIRYSMVDVYKTLCKELHVIHTKYTKYTIPSDIMLNCDSFVPVHMRKKKKHRNCDELNPILTRPIGISVIGDESPDNKPNTSYPTLLTTNTFNTGSHVESQLSSNSFNDAGRTNNDDHDSNDDQYGSNTSDD